MTGTRLLETLRGMCRDIDEGRVPCPASLRRIVLPLALPAALGLGVAGCGPMHTPFEDPVEDCTNGVDDDGDGLVDCADPDCFEHDYCLVDYGAPFPDPAPLYAAGFEDCGNGVDDDGDGLVDCDDPDCETAPECGGGDFLYAAPFEEVCDDGVDNDGDGLVDCDDPDCADAPMCNMVPMYGDVFEEVCDDGVDNDGDGLVDCDDPDCEAAPACVPDAPLYAVPF